ncbi:LEAF RUST 10 DISEASE-RESISTANCE LOCUS RECEPTOR-LIKE PROTEIN KINASE-like 2.1 [Mercurialis annua]|uniref:LEAF RUST 10 DISEASE-RESISTANCE LOCUS RECEPTOR-LIKE PROTEIN KINASE-like 2.1 n=1 Tax=Mercurialis annua TaxID=3986 RepID=UPI00215F9C89|nr:LEAF RUST 10 DISEASE-RESISTANCE LOCUS RECEPTOR-LIKE PROTEIN KINASE-like 2.1 [Mercurialis annua]
MNIFPLQSQFISFLFTLLSLSFLSKYGYSDNEELYYSNCAPFSCGNTTNFSYPFWGHAQPEYCGLPGFRIDCNKGSATLEIMSLKYNIIEIDPDRQILRIARLDLTDNICPTGQPLNTTLDVTLFRYTSNDENATLLYNCDFSSESQLRNEFDCSINNVRRKGYLTWPSISTSEFAIGCNVSVSVPVLERAVEGFLQQKMTVSQVLSEGFEIWWISDQVKCRECLMSDGRCGNNLTTNGFSCLCRDRPYDRTCLMDPAAKPSTENNSGSDKNIKLEVGIGIGASLGVIGILITSCVIIDCSKKNLLWKINNNNQKFEAFLESYGPLPVKRYNFSQIKKMTNSFKHKLGQGGYGTVFKGNLSDIGCPVAVKILNVSKEEGEEFINEVASISRTSHVNVVTLLGFCLQGDKKVLIYEFMPNGSLDKFIGNATTHDQHLEWKIMHEIAIGIARGLEYLHRGCNTRIVHFDIKPHNILLDDNLCPKISDFGLAKLCTRNESIISIIEARGTIGYIAPEVFSRNFGKVSYKSDVYSYGMMVLEMIGGKKRDEADETDRTSETYFPNWIYRRLELSNICELYGGVSVEEGDIVRKLTMVGLWCIQTNPSDRPSMSNVLEMLHGSTEALEFPPKPFLSSPPRSLPSCLYTTSTSIGE